jgi:hypothetical protein
MMHILQRSLFCVMALAAAVTAQNDDAEFNQRQAKTLNSFAKKAYDKGFPRIAKVVWMQTIKL